MIKAQIRETILALQAREGVRVLYACESGSRAWGFASPDSDYDLRFIYAHSQEWFLQLEKKNDYIDLMLPNDLDLSGWELSKALKLFASCNLALNEWLDSPEVYWEEKRFKESLSELIAPFFNPRKALHHYLSMAQKVSETSFDGHQIGIKKFFYVLRPLVACRWILEKEAMPPTRFQELLDSVIIEKDILQQVSEIRAKKEVADEGEKIVVSPGLFDWIQAELSRFESKEDTLKGSQKPGWGELNEMMIEWTQPA